MMMIGVAEVTIPSRTKPVLLLDAVAYGVLGRIDEVDYGQLQPNNSALYTNSIIVLIDRLLYLNVPIR
jgi:hypothetical protein